MRNPYSEEKKHAPDSFLTISSFIVDQCSYGLLDNSRSKAVRAVQRGTLRDNELDSKRSKLEYILIGGYTRLLNK